MHRNLVACLVFAVSCSSAMAGNYATCLLDNLPGTQNGVVHAAAISMCAQQHPGKFYEIEQGSGRSLLGYSSGTTCTIDKGKNTPWAGAAYMIRQACECLYTKANGKPVACDGPWKAYEPG